MSSNLPPTGPPPPPSGSPWGAPAGPPAGGPSGPPLGPPPSQPPQGWPQGTAEVLQSGRGGPVPPAPPRGGRGGRRAGFIAGGTALGLGVLAAAAWAGYSMFLATGPQPAEALPDSTVGYVSVDLDPSGKQKLEALKTLRKFPAFAENVDLAADDDLRARLFEEIQGDGLCPDLDFDADIDPWLGNRFAAAAIDLGEPDTGPLGVTGVGVFQVDDAAAAEDGLAALNACGGENDAFGWSVVGDWAVVAETTEIAVQVTDAAADSPLTDDEDFDRWTGEAGDPGILTAYLAPEAGELISEAAGVFSDLGDLVARSPADCFPPLGEDPFGDDPFGDDPFADDPFETCGDTFAPEPGVGDELTAMFDDFEGAALTIRFNDGGLEIEAASGSSYLGAGATESDGGDDVVTTLPESTAVAFGIGLEEGWFDDIREYADGFLGDGGLDELLAQAEAETGLSLPADLETLLGESSAIVLDGDADLTAFDEPEPPTDLQLGIKVKGDGDSITDILDKLLATAGDDSLDTLLGYDSEGDFVVAGPSADYRDSLLQDGGLGATEAYRGAVVNSDEAGSVLFVNFDAGDWLTSLPDLPDEIRENLDPLQALGFSAWTDGEVSHTAFRITAD